MSSHQEHTENAISLENVHLAETKTHELCRTLLEIYQDEGNNGNWLLSAPTVLDAHVVAFLGRLLDMQRRDLVPDALREYTERIRGRVEWEEVMHGRSSIWSVAVGHVHLLDPM